VDLSLPRPATEDELERSKACCLCKSPSSATNHVCPACHASICFPCARTKLSEKRCPACGDAEKNAEPLGHYLAIGEAWEAAMGIAKNAEGVLVALNTGVENFATRALSSDLSPLVVDHDRSAFRRAMTCQSRLETAHSCFLCSSPSSAFDVACSKCSVVLCVDCVGLRLGEKPCCPGCKDTEVFNASTVRFHQGAKNITASAASLWEGMWYLGKELFTGSPEGSPTSKLSPPGAVEAVPRAPASAHATAEAPLELAEMNEELGLSFSSEQDLHMVHM